LTSAQGIAQDIDVSGRNGRQHPLLRFIDRRLGRGQQGFAGVGQPRHQDPAMFRVLNARNQLLCQQRGDRFRH